MNAMLHDIGGKIYLCDTLSNQGNSRRKTGKASRSN